MIKSIIILPCLAISAQAFTPTLPTKTATVLFEGGPSDQSSSPIAAADADADASFVEGIKTRFRIAQESNAKGLGGKQVLADVIAGEYDEKAVEAMIDEAIVSAPCVMFTWESSPSCKKAVEAFETTNANVKIIRLDDPWSEGNRIRAALGRKVGRSSVPCVFIGGEYVGGFDGGVGDEAPGMVALAFKGTLRGMLDDAGALN